MVTGNCCLSVLFLIYELFWTLRNVTWHFPVSFPPVELLPVSSLFRFFAFPLYFQFVALAVFSWCNGLKTWNLHLITLIFNKETDPLNLFSLIKDSGQWFSVIRICQFPFYSSINKQACLPSYPISHLVPEPWGRIECWYWEQLNMLYVICLNLYLECSIFEHQRGAR